MNQDPKAHTPLDDSTNPGAPTRVAPDETIWVCTACLLDREHAEPHPDAHDDDLPPWSVLPLQIGVLEVTVGISRAAHRDRDCTADQDTDCDCETNPHSTLPCDGCGTPMHGTRHAYTLWRPHHEQRSCDENPNSPTYSLTRTSPDPSPTGTPEDQR